MIKVVYELTDGIFNIFLKLFEKNDRELLKRSIQNELQNAFDEGREFQKRYKEEDE